jgi:putative addiction module CopG family antidote
MAASPRRSRAKAAQRPPNLRDGEALDSCQNWQTASITLTNELADAVKAKVDSGEYASESEVIRDGLRILMARDRAMERWLRQQAGPALDAITADPRAAEQSSKYAQHSQASTRKQHARREAPQRRLHA